MTALLVAMKNVPRSAPKITPHSEEHQQKIERILSALNEQQLRQVLMKVVPLVGVGNMTFLIRETLSGSSSTLYMSIYSIDVFAPTTSSKILSSTSVSNLPHPDPIPKRSQENLPVDDFVLQIQRGVNLRKADKRNIQKLASPKSQLDILMDDIRDKS